ncbi:MAG TPA: hypothetical protein VM011_08650 [Gammaproteobacteria bacterium]|nr:hypothetical protein [Gammaproteobacteria bacterium]
MARTKSTARAAVAPGRKASAGKTRSVSSTAGKAARKDADQNAAQADWEDVVEELDVIPDIDGLLDKPAANRSSENEARRRIERLREERLLQQALSEVFDFQDDRAS